MLKYASRDLLSIWPEEAFERQFMSTRIINRSVFIANCPDVIRHVLVTNHANYEKKSPLLRKAFEPLLGDGLFISDGETWRQRRAMAEALFSPEQVAGFTAVMVKAAEECAQGWSTLKQGATLNVLPEMLALSTRIIYRILFGDQADSGQVARLIDGMADYHAAGGKLDLNTFFGLPSWIPGIKRNQATLVAGGIHAIIDKLIADGVNGDDKDSILARLLRRQGNEALTPVQIRNELMSLFMAGQETAANTLAWAWYLISQCPDVEQRLHKEIDDVTAFDSVTFDDFAKLPYARAIIEESMRLYPPVPILSREAVGDDIIRKRPVPAGSIVLVAPWLLHRHKLYWDRPDHFMPERFLADAPVKPDEFAYIPFSAGPRACVAKFFGTVETTLCLAILARHFRLALPEGQPVTHECRLTLRPGNNLPMRIMAR